MGRRVMTEYVAARLDALLADDTARGEAAHVPRLPPPRAAPPTDPADPRSLPAAEDPLAPERVWLRRRHLPVVVLLVVLAVALSGFAVLRARAEHVPLQVETSNAPSVRASSTPAASSPAPRIEVHVIGKVRRPGVVRLAVGARVHDAIEKAGGLRSGASTGSLNLARPLVDGEQVVVDGSRSSAGGDGGVPGGSSTATSAGARLDLNSATQAQLEALPGVGPVMAQNILTWRQQHGRFSRVEELQEIDGVGPKTYERLAPLVRV